MDLTVEREPARTPVSLRLPAEVVREVKSFAQRQSIRKTDAYLYFLKLGLANEQARSLDGAKSAATQEPSAPPQSLGHEGPPCAADRRPDAHGVRPAASMLEEKLDRILLLLQERQTAVPRMTAGEASEKTGRCHAATSSDRDKERDDICEVIRQTSGLFPAITCAYLFGSVARNTFSDESDIDIRVEIDPDRSFNLHDLVHYAKYIEQQTGRQADVISARVIRNETLARAIEREGVLVYER